MATPEEVVNLLGPYFVLISGALGGLAGYVLKAALDIWTERVKWRQELATHVITEIEKIAPRYYLMRNFANLLSISLNQYVNLKRNIQLEALDSDSAFSTYQMLDQEARRIGKDALFNAAKLYLYIEDHLWVKGGRYVLADRWAVDAMVDLHDGLMSVFLLNMDSLSKYIKLETRNYEFMDLLKRAESGDPNLRDLYEAYNEYTEWLRKEDYQVKKATAFAQSYADLFVQQIFRLYKDWFQRDIS